MLLERLVWMAGHWIGRDGTTVQEEFWTAPAGGLMVGLHRDVFGPSRAFFEYLRLEGRDDTVVYQASPGGGPTTPFELVELHEARAVFANPEHGHPQRIIYWRDGDVLHARIEGLQRGQPVASEWSWQLAGPVNAP